MKILIFSKKASLVESLKLILDHMSEFVIVDSITKCEEILTNNEFSYILIHLDSCKDSFNTLQEFKNRYPNKPLLFISENPHPDIQICTPLKMDEVLKIIKEK